MYKCSAEPHNVLILNMWSFTLISAALLLSNFAGAALVPKASGDGQSRLVQPSTAGD